MNKFKFASCMVFIVIFFSVPIVQAVMAPLAQETLVQRADVIVRGYVLALQSVPGQRDGDINTLVDIHVAESIKGQAPEVFTLTIPGGALDGDFYFVTNYPDFEQGQEVVLFLDASLTRLVGQILGKATLESGMVVETMLDADKYIKSLKSLVGGMPPVIDLDVHFAPTSSIKGYIRKQGVKNDPVNYDGLHWDSHSVRIYINENDPDTTGEGDAVRRSMSEWNSAPADFRFIDSGTHSQNHTELNYRNEIMWGWESHGNAIAYTAIWGYEGSTIVECDMLFLNSYDWSAQGNPGYNEMDIENIATHEFGHYLSLLDLYSDSHSDRTMYGYARAGETKKRTLHQDDINGIVHIYGSGSSTDDDTDDDSDDDVNDDSDDDDDDDDDWWPDDDDDDDEWNPNDDDDNDCGSILSLLYEDCGYSIVTAGATWSGGEAMDSCEQGSDTWDCVMACSADDRVESCATLNQCIQSLCGISTTAGGGSIDEDETGGECGFFCS